MNRYGLTLIAVVALVTLGCSLVQAGRYRVPPFLGKPIICRDRIEKLAPDYTLPSELKQLADRIMGQHSYNSSLEIKLDDLRKLELDNKEKKKVTKAALSYDSKTDKVVTSGACFGRSWAILSTDVCDPHYKHEYLNKHPIIVEFVANKRLAALIARGIPW